MPEVLSVNVAQPEPNPHTRVQTTGFGKRPVEGRVEVRAPGPKRGGLGSGLVGDHVGNRKHHGGDLQAVYAFGREDLDAWEARLHRTLPNGAFAENLTTTGYDVNEALVGERWWVGPADDPRQGVELQVTAPRIPCATFRGRMGERSWAKMFTADARSGAYLGVVRPGTVAAGDRITVLDRPPHPVSVAMVFRAITTEPHLLPDLLAAEEWLEPETVELVHRRQVVVLD